MTRTGVLVLVGVAALVGLGCDQVRDNAEQQFDPHVDGVLTVATTSARTGILGGRRRLRRSTAASSGRSPTRSRRRFDLELEVVDVPFEPIVAGDLGGADMAIAQISITDERAEDVDFSTSYYVTSAGVLGRPAPRS